MMTFGIIRYKIKGKKNILFRTTCVYELFLPYRSELLGWNPIWTNYLIQCKSDVFWS